LRIRLILATFFAFLVFSPVLRADTFKIVELINDTSLPVGILSNGNVVVERPYDCPATHSGHCWLTFQYTTVVNYSESLPNLPYDNGTPCNVPVQFAFRGVCNGNRYAYTMAGDFRGTFEGIFGIPGVTPIGGLADSIILLNSIGDATFIEGDRDALLEAFNLTSRITPEPSSFALLGTGLLSLAGMWKKFV